MLAHLFMVSVFTIGQTDAAKANGLQPPEANAEANGTYRIYDEGRHGFTGRFLKAYVDEFRPKPDNGDDTKPPARRALPAPLNSPPFPMTEWQGFPLIGVPKSNSVYPLM